MKKLLLVFLLGLLYSCVGDGTVLVDTFKFNKFYDVDLNITNVYYNDDYSMFFWKVSFIEKYTNQKMFCVLYLGCKDALKDIIFNGNYKIKAKVIYNLNTKKFDMFPIWIYKNKQIKLNIESIEIDENENKII